MRVYARHGTKPPPRFHLTRYAGVLTSNAALRAEAVPGHARENARSDVTNDTAQVELFGEEKNEAVRIAASSGMASPAGVRRGGSRVRALCR